MSILEEIVEVKHREVDSLRSVEEELCAAAEKRPPGHDFIHSLAGSGSM